VERAVLYRAVRVEARCCAAARIEAWPRASKPVHRVYRRPRSSRAEARCTGLYRAARLEAGVHRVYQAHGARVSKPGAPRCNGAARVEA
jgi:hypothetical protein